jgi:PadR family transcriptional regulator, regulatory protein PadR
MAQRSKIPPLGEFEQLTLLALLRLEPEAYGASMQREIATRTARPVLLSAVYTTLDRLERKGLVTSWIGEPTPERGGRRKKYYRLEPVGAEALTMALRTVKQLASGIERRLASRAGASR